jgi:hypothetical protein
MMPLGIDPKSEVLLTHCEVADRQAERARKALAKHAQAAGWTQEDLEDAMKMLGIEEKEATK